MCVTTVHYKFAYFFLLLVHFNSHFKFKKVFLHTPPYEHKCNDYDCTELQCISSKDNRNKRYFVTLYYKWKPMTSVSSGRCTVNVVKVSVYVIGV